MYRTLVVAAFFLLSSVSSAGICNVPAFEKFAPQNAPVSLKKPFLQIDMQPVAQLRIPAGFSKIGALPSGSIGFSRHPDGISALLGFETEGSLEIHKKGVKPALFLLSIFKGIDLDGCCYLQSFQLESQDYRLHANLEEGAKLFAYGERDRNQFYLIRSDKPDYVLTGLFRNVSRIKFESILSTLTIE